MVCSELANKRKQAKLLWLQNPNDQTADLTILGTTLAEPSEKRNLVT